jgi:hypothetical protein
MSEPTEHNLNHQRSILGKTAIPIQSYPDLPKLCRQSYPDLPKLCRQLRPMSSGSEISPGETVAIASGMLSDTMFPDLIAVAGSFEFEVSLEFNRAGRILSSRDRGDLTDLASVGALLRHIVLPSGSHLRLVVRNVGDAPRFFTSGIFSYLSVVEERERFLDALDRHTQTDAWLDEIRDLEQGAQRLRDDADRICTEQTDSAYLAEHNSWFANLKRKMAAKDLHRAEELRLRGRGAVPSWWEDDHQHLVDLSEEEARQFDVALARCADGSPRRVIGVDVNVDPDFGIDAFSGPIRFRGLDDALIPVTCDGPSRVLPNKSAWFIARSERAFRPKGLEIDHHSQDWRIVDVHVDGKSQFPQAGEIPGDAFHPNTLDCFAAFDGVPAGGSFAIRAHYVGSKPRGGRFGAVVRGRLDP